MTKSTLTIAAGLAMLLASVTGVQAAGTTGIAKAFAITQTDSIIQRAHSVYEAQHKLQRLGYYAIQTQRASEPYSFIACKRGQRFHIHVDYYGDLIQVDDAGSCENYGYNDGSQYYEPRRRYSGGYRYSGYRRYRDDVDY
jgi:peptidoglycan hydrolase-like protein with peptidoglycan-binding domain